jgi:hypothetical protein
MISYASERNGARPPRGMTTNDEGSQRSRRWGKPSATVAFGGPIWHTPSAQLAPPSKFHMAEGVGNSRKPDVTPFSSPLEGKVRYRMRVAYDGTAYSGWQVGAPQNLDILDGRPLHATLRGRLP